MEEQEWSDGQLIAGSIQRPELFGVVFERHHQAIAGFALRRVGADDAGEVVGDAFERAFRIRERFDPTSASCLPWLYGIASNIVGDRLRRARRRERIYLVLGEAPSGDDSDVADDRLVAEQLARTLNRLLGQLAKNDREALLLYALEGLTYSDISTILGIPVGTVGSRIHRARQRLLEQLPSLEQIAEQKIPDNDPGMEL